MVSGREVEIKGLYCNLEKHTVLTSGSPPKYKVVVWELDKVLGSHWPKVLFESTDYDEAFERFCEEELVGGEGKG